jgi:hypothetical protein
MSIPVPHARPPPPPNTQGPALFGLYHSRIAAAVGCASCLACLAAYCTYQLTEPEAQRKKMRAARKHLHRMYAVGKMQEFSSSFGGLLHPDGRLNIQTCASMFSHFDTDANGFIEKTELHALLTGLAISDDSFVFEDVDNWMADFDTDKDSFISELEFTNGRASRF